MAVWDNPSLNAAESAEAAPGGQLPRDMTGLEGGMEPADFGSASFPPAKRSPAGGLLLILAVLAVGGATLYAMRLSGRVEATDASLVSVEKKIEQALQRLKGENKADPSLSAEALSAMFKDTDEVVATFASDPTKKQVTLDNLQKNPFELFVSEAAKTKTTKSADETAAQKAKEERQKKLKTELASFKLQSLLSSGGQGLAVIAGKVVREGDVIGSFTVTGISPSGVLLTAEGNSYALTMEQPGDKAKKN